MSDKKLTARQYSVKAIHEDKLNVRNPSILAKLLKDYASIQCREQHRNTRHQAAELCAEELRPDLHHAIMNLNQIEPK